jgi:hypothetical protein
MNTIAVQLSTGYDLLHFSSEANARAYVAVNKIQGARRPSDAYGRKQNEIDLTGYLGERIESLATSIETGELDQPARRVELHQNATPQQRRTYTSGPVIKVVAIGQRIGLLTPVGVLPAVVAHLGNNYITVNLDNGRGPRNIERRIDATTTGPGLTLSAIVSPQQVTA